ncbi:MAG: RluA family pseudouridine synthase [Candidatus Omnitrophica bacterium]|nr:RluA family pseudouridine synthase [Candidatus Omnitrophota bacterium]
MFELIVIQEDSGKRVDNVVTKNMVAVMPELEISRSMIQRMIDKGEILLSGNIVKSGYKVKPNDKIEMDLEKLKRESLIEHDGRTPKAEKLPLDIIYEDDDILAVNKPAGMVVHPACGNYSGTLVNALLDYPGFLTDFNKPKNTKDERLTLRPGIVHRLDKDTSGVIVIAKNGVALRKLSKQFKNRTVTKKYIAVVRGIIELDEGVIKAPLAKDKKNRIMMRVDEEGKEAITYYHVVKRDEKRNFTVLEVTPKTGRTHQIRIHLSHIGHPVLGDTLYNGPIIKGLSRHALHAKSIIFTHPTKNKPIEFSANLPSDIALFLS